ncbi:MAG: PAS domain-containing protein [Verrucomicrobia bacterium]|nr:MAG: PAS domain-containing protein [Verrucomicrobiota bacterium]
MSAELWFTGGVAAVAVAGFLWSVRREQATRDRLRDTSLRLAELRTQRHLALVGEQSKQQALLDSMVEGVLLLDEQGRVEHVNPALVRLFDLPKNIRGLPLSEAIPSPELSVLADRAARQGRIVDQELSHPGDSPLSLQVNAVALRDPDRLHAGTLLVFHDLTQHALLAEQRREFVANVSHELRTPLSLIKGYTETLLGGAKDDPETATRFLRTIDKHADRLTFLIEDLLTVSRLESGQVIMNLQPTSLHDVAAQVIDDLLSKAAERSTALCNEVPSELRVHGDGDRLQQVLSNLVDNAIKYGRPNGRVVVGARSLHEDLVEAWVADDGMGIPPEARERVFERFDRVDKGRSREQGGTGLGLSIVKHIVQAHGGEVRVESEVGKGSCFYFTLPRVNEPA